MHQEEFTLDMERYLIEHYWDDPRLANDTYRPGQRSGRSYEAYALYMAFRYADVLRGLQLQLPGDRRKPQQQAKPDIAKYLKYCDNLRIVYM